MNNYVTYKNVIRLNNFLDSYATGLESIGEFEKAVRIRSLSEPLIKFLWQKDYINE